MKFRCSALLACCAIVLTAGCGELGPGVLKHDSDSTVLFKRVTLAAAAPDRAEVEVEVRTGSNFSQPAADGTAVILETSLGVFATNQRRIEVHTVGGHAVATLILPEPSRVVITARSADVEAQLTLDVNPDGSIKIDPP